MFFNWAHDLIDYTTHSFGNIISPYRRLVVGRLLARSKARLGLFCKNEVVRLLFCCLLFFVQGLAFSNSFFDCVGAVIEKLGILPHDTLDAENFDDEHSDFG